MKLGAIFALLMLASCRPMLKGSPEHYHKLWQEAEKELSECVKKCDSVVNP